MFHSFYKSRKWALWAYGGGALLIMLLWLQVQLTVAFNTWYGRFYDLFQKSGEFKDNPQEGIDQFIELLIGTEYIFNGFEGALSFSVIVFPYIFLAAFTSWFTRIYALRWREAMRVTGNTMS